MWNPLRSLESSGYDIRKVKIWFWTILQRKKKKSFFTSSLNSPLIYIALEVIPAIPTANHKKAKNNSNFDTVVTFKSNKKT